MSDEDPATRAALGEELAVTELRRDADAALSTVVDAVDQLLNDFDVVDLLDDLTRRCAALLDIASSGLLLADGTGRLHLMSSTSGRTRELELLQLQQNEGPCLDCYHSGHPVTVPDLAATSGRWPVFTEAAVDAGFASVHAVPMRAGATVLGALGLFGTTPGDLAVEDVAVAQTLAHIATVALLQQPPAPATVLTQLGSALADRTIVEQARGLISQTFDTDVDDALGLLREQAHSTGTHLTDLARAIMSGGPARAAALGAVAARRGGH